MNHVPFPGLGDGLTLGERLRGLRAQNGVTLRQVAFSAEVNHSLLSRWERDQLAPSLRSFARIAEYYRVTMGSLYWGIPADKEVLP